MTHDLVIRNGTVVDGSGPAGVRADVAVDGDRITEVGRVRDTGREEIDADGLVVTPGFVDGHTHMDAQVMWDALGSCSCWHGVTTVVMGNCGFTLGPVRRGDEALVVRNLERAEDIAPAALAAGIDWTWESFAGYLDAVDARPKAINYAGYVGHSALRTWAMGERAFDESASDEDMALMERELSDALRAGAIGLSTSRISQHQTSDDRPVASRIASWQEVQQLVGVLGELGAGIFELAPEIERDFTPEQQQQVFDDLRDLAVATRVPTTFGVLPTPRSAGLIRAIEEAAARGGNMFGQTHSKGVSTISSFLTKLPFDRLPAWQEVRSLPHAEQLAKLQDPEVRARLVRATQDADYGNAVGGEARAPEYDQLLLLDTPMPPYRSVGDVARELGVHPVEVIIDRSVATGLAQLFMQSITPATDEAIVATMRTPRTAMTFSDAGAHVSQIADASIQTHLLGYWVRERQEFTFEEAVRMITLAPATLWSFADRGMVRAGFAADLNVLDPATIGPQLPKVEHDLPAGAVRLVQKSAGIASTIVGGQLIMRDGEHTGALPGQLLRGPLAR